MRYIIINGLTLIMKMKQLNGHIKFCNNLFFLNHLLQANHVLGRSGTNAGRCGCDGWQSDRMSGQPPAAPTGWPSRTRQRAPAAAAAAASASPEDSQR